MKKTILALSAAALLAVSAIPAQAAEKHKYYLLQDCSTVENVKECQRAKIIPSIILGGIFGGVAGGAVFGALGGTLAAGSTVAIGTTAVTLPTAVAVGVGTGAVVGGGTSLLAE